MASADGAEFNFLSATWGIELAAKGKAEIADYCDSLQQKDVKEYIKDSDIRKLGVSSKLPKEIARLNGPVPPGKYLVQIQKIVDITQPVRFQEDFEGGKWRLLKFDLSDGEQKLAGLEYVSLMKLELGVHVPPGTKLLLHSTGDFPLMAQNGHLLLRPELVEWVGGNVDKLIEGWKASKDVEESRLKWRTEGVKMKEKGALGAPPWVDFDPKKAPRGTQKALEEARKAKEEKAQWLKGGSLDELKTRAGVEDEEERGPRFQMEEFAEETTTAVHSTVTSSAFKREERSKGGKKGGKKSDAGDDGGYRGRRGKGEDLEPEKRAPAQATMSIAALIKPTKTGELPDAAAAILAPEPKKPAASEAAWDDAAWGEGSWDAGGWDDGWGAGWSSGGWGGGGRGGGKGSRKGGGGKKGGGKRRGY